MKRKSGSFKRGTTLVTVMVSAVIGIIVLMALFQGIADVKKGQKSVQSSIDFDTLKTTISMVLSNPQTCRLAFKHKPATGPVVTAKFGPSVTTQLFNQLVLSSGTSTSLVAEQGQDLGGGLRVRTLQLRYQSGFTAGIPSGTNTNHYVELYIELIKGKDTSAGTRIISNALMPFKFMIATDNSTNDIVDCAGSEEQNLYASSCVVGVSYPICCRVHRYNGNMDCKQYNGTIWGAIASPYAATTLGIYGIATSESSGNRVVVCRTNGTSGAAECSNTSALTISWATMASPF